MAINDSESTRLANRAAALSFGSAFALVVALVTFSKAFDEASPWLARLAAGMPVVAAVLLLVWATHARMRWSAHRRPPLSHAGPQAQQHSSPSRPAPGSRPAA